MRFVVISLFAFWIGGFTFYGSVVIPTAVDVLGSHVDVGFITRQVSYFLNISGCIALGVFLVNMAAGWRIATRAAKWGVLASWLVMLGMNVAMMILHPRLDRMLDVETTSISNRADFARLHKVYLAGATAQWGAGLLHLWCVMLIWRRQDRQRVEARSASGTNRAEPTANFLFTDV